LEIESNLFDKNLHAEVDMVIFENQDTTASGISWHALTVNSEQQQRYKEEVQRLLVLEPPSPG
jgi:hypothetical protein